MGSRTLRSVCMVVCLAGAFSPLATVHAQPTASAASARTITLCTACHRDKFASLEHNPHGQLDTPEWQERTGLTPSCLNCHGDVAEHIRAGGGRGSVFAFREEAAAARNERCLSCHRETHPGFDRSPHALAGLACTSCHSQHGSAPDPAPLYLLRAPSGTIRDLSGLGGGSAICSDCHPDKLAEFEFNEHHRLREGVLECVSCHDPHAPATRSLLGGFKQQQCATCHTDKGGPFVFEHGASRIEGCTACHTPHGSPNRHLLAHQRVAELCLSCHAAIPQFHLGFSSVGPSRFGLDTQCTNCHSSIHGSNLHPFFLE